MKYKKFMGKRKFLNIETQILRFKIMGDPIYGWPPQIMGGAFIRDCSKIKFYLFYNN